MLFLTFACFYFYSSFNFVTRFDTIRLKKRPKILLIDTVHPLLQSELEKFGFQCDSFPESSLEKILLVISQYTGVIIRSKIPVNKMFLEKATQLKFIARAGAGMENIDMKFAKKQGVICINAPEGNRDSVAEHALGMLLSLFNKLNKAHQEIKNGIWDREGNRGIELKGKTIGIIGYGNTGGAFAKRLKGFGVNVLAHDKYKSDFSDEWVKEARWEDIFARADVLSLHVPLTDETKYLINEDVIKRFHKNIYLINTSRGKVVNTEVLVKHLKTGKIKGACLDVLEYESSSFENFFCDSDTTLHYLTHSEQVILSPHVAGWTYESYQRISEVLVEKIKKLLL